MLEGFAYKEQFIGDGTQTDYEFDFYCSNAANIKIYIQDPNGLLVTETMGDDATVVASVTLNEDNMGGVISLVSNFPTSYVATLLTANDFPDQPFPYGDKQAFNLSEFEGSLDFFVHLIQRVAYLVQRSFRLHDLDDIDGVDPRLPMGFAENPEAIVQINAAGTQLEYGLSVTEIVAQVVVDVMAQVQALIDALFVFTIIHKGPWTVGVGGNLNLPGEVTNGNIYTEVDYVARIRRGGTVYARQEFSIFFRGVTWEIAIAGDRYADAGSDHGVTFTVSPTGQINAAVANDGGPDAIIDIEKNNWPV